MRVGAPRRLILAAGELGVGATGFALKPLVDRHRPPESLVWVNWHPPGDPWTFTAGHVHTAVVMFGWVAYLVLARRPGTRLLRTVLVGGAIIVVLVTSFSRVYLGEHWTSDVLGAYLLGGIWLALEVMAYARLAPRFAKGRSG